MLSLWSSLLPLATLIWNPAKSLAQSTQVTTCSPEYAWASNSKQQNPCLVAAYLETTCLGQPYIIPAIPAGTHYIPPTAATANPCLCNTVYYSLISACGGCQGRTYSNWTAWSGNCSQIFVTKFPRDIPPATEVPTWAYLNVTETNNNFDPLRAKLVTEQAPTSSGSTTTSATPLTSQAPPTTPAASTSQVLAPSSGPSPASASQDSGTSTNAGAIAGGVVGGIVFLAIVALAIFWFRSRKGEDDTGQGGSRVGSWVRRQNRRRKKSNSGKIDLDDDAPPVTPFPPSLSQKPDPRFAASSPISGLTTSGTVMQTVQDLRPVTSPSPPAQGMSSITTSPYSHTREISDPISPVTSAFFTTGHRNSVDTLPYTGSHVTRGGAYTGAAEV
jgi:hypothetical protein